MTSVQFSRSPAWSLINQLGERLLVESQLVVQKELILQTTAKLMGAETDLWLDERLFHLPGLNEFQVFSPDPPVGLLQGVIEDPGSCCVTNNSSIVAFPIRTEQLILGALSARRLDGKKFRKHEIEWLETLTGHCALALTTSHRAAIEKWRIEQLTLVRQVSAQIANVLNLGVLTRRVTRLILDTFRFYYVAIFTVEEGRNELGFQASAGPGRSGTKRKKLSKFHIRLGQGLIGTSAKDGLEIISNNVREEPRFRYLAPLPGTQSEVVLPLKIDNQVLGVLDIQSDRINAFHPNDLLVLRALADTIATAVNSARLYSTLERRADHLSIVAEVSEEINSVLELEELLTRVAVLIKEKLKYSYVHLFTVHSNRRQIIFEGGSVASSQTMKGYTINLDNGEGVIPWVARNGKSILANDISKESRYVAVPYLPQDTRAELTIPLMYAKQPVGILDVQSSRANVFSEEDRYILEALGDNIAVAIRNAGLFRTERWRRQVADSLREVAGLLSADAGVDEVLDSVLRELERNLPCEVSAAWLLDGNDLYLAHIHGAELMEVEAAANRWPDAKKNLLNVLDANQPIIRKPADPFGPTGIARGYSADYSSIAVPLRVGERTLGVISLSHHTSGRYGHEAQAIIATFASYAAVAIENTRLFDAAQEQAYASAALLQVAQTVVNTNSLEETIGSIVRITPILVGVKACAIYLWDENNYQRGQGYGFPDDVQVLLCGRILFPGDYPLLDLARDKLSLVVGVLAQSLPEDWLEPEIARDEQETYYALQTGEHLLIALPLIVRNDFFGILLIQEDADVRRFRDKRIEIVTGIAQQVAMSIQNYQLQKDMVVRERFEHEIQLARQIQRTFLPEKLPEVANWDLAAVWRTAREVGGDFYDVFELPSRKLGLFIADVSDKGIPAAIFMALTRTLVRAAVLDTTSPAEVMRRVNSLIIPDNREGMFVTAVYGVLELDTGVLTFANAGHNPPIFIHGPERELITLHRTGAALGVIENMEMDERAIEILNDDLLLLYTDGLTEAFSVNEEPFGVERVNQAICQCKRPTALKLLDALEKAVEIFIDSQPPADDLTMLAIHRAR